MRATAERWKKTQRVLCHDSRFIDGEIELCAFDQGFLLGYEFAKSSCPPTTKAVKMILTPGPPRTIGEA
jgi:hypothetical protein